ncbi:TolB family protein [Melittangium boletus]|uniref:TolB family protein n=1 Tax=Melittangium boletus TaxID=83453 RepID=UPI003DA36C80
MTKRNVVIALMGALAMVATGCSKECETAADCSDKGSAGAGKQWTCSANACVASDVTTPPTETPDAGTGTPDAGTGTPDAGSGDAGTPPPAGDMTIAEDGDCSTTASCMAGLYCEAQKCKPLHLVVTERVGSGGSTTDRAVVVYYKTPGAGTATPPAAATTLSQDTSGTSRFPRWNREGTAVAFENTGTDSTVALWSRPVPFGTASQTQLTTAAAAGTSEFRYMEWAPSKNIAWAKTAGGSTTGISYIEGTGGTVQAATANGVFPSWAGDGNSFAYSANGQGLKNRSFTTGADAPIAGPSTSAEQPMHNQKNDVLIYLDAKGNTENIGGTTYLTGLYAIAPGGTEKDIALARTESTEAGGEVKSFIANHTFSPTGTHLAYVRVYYYKPTVGSVVLCNGSNCGGRQGNVVFVHTIDEAGVPGSEINFANEATLPSFSPDGYFLAYVSGSRLQVQKLNPAGTDAATLKDGAPLSHTWGTLQTNRGDDHRPRWQPR